MASVRDFKLLRGLDEQRIGLEGRAASDDHAAVKLWLRLLACSTQIEQEIRARLRQRFATTLPRFDYLAQLERHPRGLRMNALSRYLMVTGGNVTGLTDQLVAERFVERLPDPEDRRSLIVRLTDAGRARFLEMAAEHELWLIECFDGFDPDMKSSLYAALGQLRLHLAGKQTGKQAGKQAEKQVKAREVQDAPLARSASTGRGAPRRRAPERSPGAKPR